jgi:hypothetical protein
MTVLADDPRAESVIDGASPPSWSGRMELRRVGSFRATLTTGWPAVNVASMIGLGSVRGVVG